MKHHFWVILRSFRVILWSFSGHQWPADRLTSVKVMSMGWSHGKSKREVGNRLGYREIYFSNWGVMSNGSKRNQSQGWKRGERIKNIKSWNSLDWKRSKQGIRFFSWINLRSFRHQIVDLSDRQFEKIVRIKDSYFSDRQNTTNLQAEIFTIFDKITIIAMRQWSSWFRNRNETQITLYDTLLRLFNDR